MIRQRLPQKGTPDEFQPRDLFQTPKYATDLLVPFIPTNITHIWECACGERRIADRLEFWGFKVLGSDIRGLELERVTPTNFLTDPDRTDFSNNHSAIITNPPYSLKRQFFNKCVEYDIPFALLISADYCGWTIDAIRKYGCEKIIPDKRIDFITPTGKSGATGQSAYFHSLWLTRGFEIGKSETFVELTKEMKKNI
jgi:hypothetical protein